MRSLIFHADFFFSVLRITAPILFATLGAVVSQRAGVTNIGLEGIMMLSALFGSLAACWSGSWEGGLLAAMLVGVCAALGMGACMLRLKTNMILTGIAVNLVGSGGTLFLVKVITSRTQGAALTSTSSLVTKAHQIPVWDVPLIGDIPVLGDILSGHCILTYLAFGLVFLTWAMLYKTALGISIRAVGEAPEAAASAGVQVERVKYGAIAVSGLMAGFGGAYMSMYYTMGWSQDMVAGRGFIALAAQAVGAGEPVASMMAALGFGFAQALGIKASSLGVDSNLVSPIPYLATILGLTAFSMFKHQKATRKREI